MKAARVYSPFGKENLKIEEIDEPTPSHGEVLVRVEKAGLNPIDYNLIHGKIVYNLQPVPHIPGSEVIGTVISDGLTVKKGDKVMVYNRIFDGSCEFCLSNREHLCKNGGIWGVVTNGGYAETIAISESNLFKIPSGLDEDTAVSVPIGALTSYRALLRAGASVGKSILIYGASGNTGIFAIQIAKAMGMDVYAVSRKKWLKDYGVADVFEAGEILETFTADIVMNSLGSDFWESSLKHVSVDGALVTFGVLSGREGKVDIANLYTREMRIIGSTGGTRKDLHDLLSIMKRHPMKAPVSKKFSLSNISEALEYYTENRDGRIVIEI